MFSYFVSENYSSISSIIVAVCVGLTRATRCRGIPGAEAALFLTEREERAAGALRIPPVCSFACSFGPSIGDSQFRVVGEERIHPLLRSSRPATATAAAFTGFCVPLRFPVLLFFSLSFSFFFSVSHSHPLHFRSSPQRPAKYHPLATLIFHG